MDFAEVLGGLCSIAGFGLSASEYYGVEKRRKRQLAVREGFLMQFQDYCVEQEHQRTSPVEEPRWKFRDINGKGNKAGMFYFRTTRLNDVILTLRMAGLRGTMTSWDIDDDGRTLVIDEMNLVKDGRRVYVTKQKPTPEGLENLAQMQHVFNKCVRDCYRDYAAVVIRK